MKDDVLRRLRAARPEHLHPDESVSSPVRDMELAAATAVPRARRSTARRPAAHPLVLSGIGLAALTAVGVLVVTGTVPGTGTGTSAAPGTTLSGRQVLLAAAAEVEKQPAGSGAYWYLEEHSGSPRKVPGKDYTLDIRHVTRIWTAAAANKRWSQQVDAGARPADEADEAAWRADGSPREWDLTDSEPVTYEGRGEIQHDAPGGVADSGRMGDIPLNTLSELPTDETALRERLYDIVDKDYNAPKKILHGMVVDTAVQIAMSLPASPELRASAYRILAEEPGVRSLGEVTDHEDRTGYAVAMPDEHNRGTELRLIFDKSTGMPLGRETVREGQLVYYTTITAMKWTDEAPPFDDDFTR